MAPDPPSPEPPSEEDKAKALENKIKAPLVWGLYEKRHLRVEDLKDVKKFDEAVDILKKHFLNTEVS